MAKCSSQTNRASSAFGLYCLILLVQKCGATDFLVGGSKGWSVPTDSNEQSFNQWAEAHRFQIGDSLVFNYPADQDSVLRVNQDDYNNCNTESPINKFSDGHTVFNLGISGPFYFISGNKDNCLKNQKLLVIVLADRSNHSSNTNQTSPLSPPPSGSIEISPSPPPSGSTEISPSPAPTGEESPPPPAGTVETSPTPAPISEPPPPPSGASSIFTSLLADIGALAISSLLLASQL